MKTIKDIDIKDKNVVIRCDYNVPMEGNIIKDNTKIVKSLPTLNYLLDNNCRIVILSHLGRVKSEADKVKNTLKYVASELANLLKREVKFVDKCYGDKVSNFVSSCKQGDIIVLENTRIMDYPEKLESSNNLELAKFFASLGDIFINDAFASLHRAHASTAGIAKFLPSAVGFLVADELKNLDILIDNTPHPFLVFMGGAKVDDKLPIITSLLPRCDYILVGGGIANSFLKAMGADVGDSIATDDPKILSELKTMLKDNKGKIILPIDFTIDDGIIYDIGSKSLDNYQKYILKSTIIFVNGTCGKFEDDRFTEGTVGLFKMLKDSCKRVIVGGGDTIRAVKKFGFQDSFSYLSSGGGATLQYVAFKKLEALEWMKQ